MIMKFLKKFKELFFSDKNESSVLESLPRKKSIDQLKMVRKISKGIRKNVHGNSCLKS